MKAWLRLVLAGQPTCILGKIEIEVRGVENDISKDK